VFIIDPEAAFAQQVRSLSGKRFENLVSAAYLHMGYLVFRNVIVTVNKQTVAEIDVLATMVTPLTEVRIAIECKGATPSFNDLRKFSSLDRDRVLPGSRPHLVAFGDDDLRREHLEFARILGIELHPKTDIRKLILPILGRDDDLRRGRACTMSRYLVALAIQDALHEAWQSLCSGPLRQRMSQYHRYLHRDLWALDPATQQIAGAFRGAMEDFRRFTEEVAQLRDRDLTDELRNPQDIAVQSAMLLELIHRLFTMYSLARGAIQARTAEGLDTLLGEVPQQVARDAIVQICESSSCVSQLAVFLYKWVFVWGGFVCKQDEELEYALIGRQCGISAATARLFIDIIRSAFSGGAGLFFEDESKLFMKYVPASLRALGALIRRLESPSYAETRFFAEDGVNLAHLLALLDVQTQEEFGLSPF